MNRAYRIPIAILAVSAAIAAAAAFAWDRIDSDPEFKLLRRHEGVDWIKFPAATSLRIHHLGEYQTSFEKRFTLDAIPGEARLRIRALADAKMYVNHTLALDRRHEPQRWHEPRTIDIAPLLSEGENAIRIEVYNENGPRLLWARCTELALQTDETWRASNTGEAWRDAVAASHIEPSQLSKRFIEPWRALLATFPLTIPVLLLVFLYQRLPRDHTLRARLSPWLRAERVRFYLMLAWLVLSINNIFKIPMVTGFDIEGHINYIHFIATRHALPLADDGWQMFQTPLYYLISAGPYWLLTQFFELDRVIQLLRAIPLLCGLAQIDVAYRIARRVFPERNDLQTAATLFAAALPMNLYISQYIGNEPMAGLLSALVCLQCVRMLTKVGHSERSEESLHATMPDEEILRSAQNDVGGAQNVEPAGLLARKPPFEGGSGGMVTLSILLALAILTKITAILLIPPVLLVAAYTAYQQPNHRLRNLALHAAILSAALGVLCGWYFARNYAHFGQLIVGGWEIERNIVWWQDPGYRTPAQFYTFGEALVRPISAGTAGLWDALYSTFWLDGLLSSMVEYQHRPPWNYPFVVAGAWLALVPAALILTGIARAWKSPNARVWHFTLAALALYLAAFAYLYLTLPTYSTGKATYTLGLTPLYALLLAGGLHVIRNREALRILAYAWLAAWAAAAYAAYFVT